GVQRNIPESNEDALQKVHGPVLLINGAERDFLTPSSLTTFELIRNVPAFYGARHGAGHTATVDHPGGGEYANVASNWLLSQCKNPPPPFAIPSAGNAATAGAAPPEPVLPPTMSIPGVLEALQSWKVVWSWQGNNVDGPIAGENGTMLFANNDAGDVIQFDPATGLAKVAHGDINTAGAVSRSKNGALFVAERRLGGGIEQLEPQRRLLAKTFNGEPLECIGGVINDLTADAKAGVYFSVTGARNSGVFY